MIRPQNCGNTLFADSFAAYNALNLTMKTFLENKTATFCYLKTRNLQVEVGLTEEQIIEGSKCVVHHVITTHPINFKKNIYVNPSHTSYMNEIDSALSDSTLEYLYNHTQSSEFVYEHVWLEDDLVMWDNRQVHHRATGCDSPRMLIRTTVSMEAPPV